MCGGGGGGDGGAAAREKKRQAEVTAGYEAIKRIFDGGVLGKNAVTDPAALQAGQKVYDGQGNELTYTAPVAAAKGVAAQKAGLISADGTMIALPTAAQLKQKANQGKTDLFLDKAEYEGFNDDFYNARATEYMNYANPQLEDQFTDAAKQLTLKLARAGLLDSSARVNQTAKLNRDYQLQKTGIADKAQEYANQARSNVEGARSELVNMNAASADSAMIANEAANRLASLKQMPQFEVLTPLFTNVGEGIATQADLERRQASRYSTGMFNPSYSGAGSSRSIR